MRMSREERLAHMDEATKALESPYMSDAAAVLALNLEQVGIDLFGETSADTLVRTAIEQFSSTLAMISRLYALGIDPENATATDDEREEIRQSIEKRLSPNILPVKVPLDERGHIDSSGGYE